MDEVCSARDLCSAESQVLKAGKVRSWSFDMVLSVGEDEGGYITGISVLESTGLSKGIVNVGAILILLCLCCVKGNSNGTVDLDG